MDTLASQLRTVLGETKHSAANSSRVYFLLFQPNLDLGFEFVLVLTHAYFVTLSVREFNLFMNKSLKWYIILDESTIYVAIFLCKGIQ